MTKVTLSGECGNSPKNAFAERCAVALLAGEKAEIDVALERACIAILPGEVETSGPDALIDALAKAVGKPEAVTILHAITHGRIGAVNGTFAKGGKIQGFALTFEFRNTKADSIAAVRLYLA